MFISFMTDILYPYLPASQPAGQYLVDKEYQHVHMTLAVDTDVKLIHSLTHCDYDDDEVRVSDKKKISTKVIFQTLVFPGRQTLNAKGALKLCTHCNQYVFDWPITWFHVYVKNASGRGV